MTTDGDAALIGKIVNDILSSADRQIHDLAGSIARRDPDLTGGWRTPSKARSHRRR